MNSLEEQAFRNQLLRDRLENEGIPYKWGNIAHLVESELPIWAAIVNLPTERVGEGTGLDIWISYSEYQATYVLDSVAGEAFNSGDSSVSLDMTIALLREFIPHL